MASKVCLVINQDDPEFKLLEGYQHFPCDDAKMEADNIKWIPIKWRSREREPSIDDISTWHVELEVLMSRSPYVQTVMELDYNHFDYQSVS